jgi:predicted RNase H-like nuclease (RuvC/YqgF family)
MTRGYYNSKHQSVDNNNIDCLKGQVEVYKKNITTLKDTINKNNYENQKQIHKLKEKNKSINDELKKEIKILKENETKYLNEIAQLKQELSEWNSSFKDIYNKLVLNKKEKNINTNHKNDDEKPIYLKTQENENERNSNHIKVKTFHLTNTPKLNNYRNFDFDKKNI